MVDYKSGDNLESKLTGEGMFIFMTDQHKPYTSERMERITQQYVHNNSELIKQLVFGGDSVDNPAMSRFVQRPSDVTLIQDEIDLFVRHVNNYHILVPDAKIYVLGGNHDVGRFDNVKSINRSMASLRCLDFAELIRESINEQGFDFKISMSDTLRLRENYFTHGDPKIDPYLKGGVTGVRRTAESHPEQGNIIHGHKHQVITYPRIKGDFSVFSVGMMGDVEKIAAQYKSFHGYQNGFLIGTYDRFGTQIDNLVVSPDHPLYVDGEEYD